MKKNDLMTGRKKVMGAVFVAAAMMLGVTACGSTKEAEAPESSVVESSAEESTVEESTEEESTDEMEVTAEESSDVDAELAETRTFTMDADGVETEFVETLFASEEGFDIWYQADFLEIAESEDGKFFIQTGVDEAAGASVTMTIVDASQNMEDVLLEAASCFSEDAYEEITVGEILTYEVESEMLIQSIEVVHDATADRFYTVSNGENALLITVTADAGSMEAFSGYFDRMAQTVEFTAAVVEENAEDSAEAASEESGEDTAKEAAE